MGDDDAPHQTTMEVLRRSFTQLQAAKRDMSSTEMMEVLVPTASDATFRLRWQIPKYTRTVSRCRSLDSPVFEVRVNGCRLRWSLSLRFWRGPGGRWVRDPAVLCLNLVSCAPSRPQQATVRFQMEILDGAASRWERVGTCGRVALQLRASEELLSLGHRDLGVRKRHVLPPGAAVGLAVSLQLCLSEEDARGLVADLDNLLNSGTGDVVILGDDGSELRAHKCILSARSPVLAAMLEETDTLELKGVSEEVLTEVLRFIYTDRVERLSSLAEPLMEAARSLRLSVLEDRCVNCLLEQNGSHQRKALHITHPGLFDEMGSSSSSGLGSWPNSSDSECDLSSPEILESDLHQGISFTVHETVKTIQ